jgi:hypothetical protein
MVSLCIDSEQRLSLLGRTGSSLLEQTARGVYQVGVRRWRTVTIGLVGLTVAGGLLVTRMPMQEDVAVMLPDSDPAFVAGYRLLEAAPFTRNPGSPG